MRPIENTIMIADQRELGFVQPEVVLRWVIEPRVPFADPGVTITQPLLLLAVLFGNVARKINTISDIGCDQARDCNA